ncbi:Aquaporin Z [Planctomycetes bacterium CA13]|uniref:Aquaporin Z n=1 Tax=Novipirellula herctigrandis TaxID=2527986 RepID=A0A5C5YNP8_9BACT|nr:Aquaporin Z [Planctomycetes bacterium CA13]
MSKKYTAEILGTFILVFSGCGAAVVNDVREGMISHAGVALVWGMVVMSLIYALGDISGAHINPAVTIGFWVAKRFEAKYVIPFIVCQCIGATMAAIFLKILFPDHPTLGSTLPYDGSVWQSFVLEVVLSFMLMFVILCVSSGAKEKGIMAGAAIGSVVGFEAMFGGPISGASMNPARSMGPAIISGNTQHLWIYLVATILGMLAAVPICQLICNGDD